MGIDRAVRRAVFLDRDGVINRAILRDGRPHPPARIEDLELLSGAAGALERLRAAGFRLVVVTNQPDVARGTQRADVVQAMHAKIASVLPIDDFRVCFHDDADACACRKPKPGLLLAAAADDGLDLAASVMVGDRWRDVEAGRRAGCRTAFIDYGYDERRPIAPDVVVASLSEAANWILRRTGNDLT
ncbi:MAG: D-glycero-alpha-D-manno-heptose-1,7-bisphosphate 7-phosphatase [Vicinamibacterales bacterium]